MTTAHEVHPAARGFGILRQRTEDLAAVVDLALETTSQRIPYMRFAGLMTAIGSARAHWSRMYGFAPPVGLFQRYCSSGIG